MSISRKTWILGGLVGGVVALSASSSQAAVAILSLELDPSTSSFNVFAKASPDDNLGIATFGIALAGDITKLENVSPVGQGAPGNKNVGFSLVRAVKKEGAVWIASGGQDVPTPEGTFFVFGFGQRGGDLNQDVMHAGGSNVIEVDIPGVITIIPTQRIYGAPLLLLSGMYDPTGVAPSIDFEDDATGINVFRLGTPEDNPKTEAALLVIPEPVSFVLWALGGLFTASRRRS